MRILMVMGIIGLVLGIVLPKFFVAIIIILLGMSLPNLEKTRKKTHDATNHGIVLIVGTLFLLFLPQVFLAIIMALLMAGMTMLHLNKDSCE